MAQKALYGFLCHSFWYLTSRNHSCIIGRNGTLVYYVPYYIFGKKWKGVAPQGKLAFALVDKIGNRVYPKRVSRVQIPPSPPNPKTFTFEGFGVLFRPFALRLFGFLQKMILQKSQRGKSCILDFQTTLVYNGENTILSMAKWIYRRQEIPPKKGGNSDGEDKRWQKNCATRRNCGNK